MNRKLSFLRSLAAKWLTALVFIACKLASAQYPMAAVQIAYGMASSNYQGIYTFGDSYCQGGGASDGGAYGPTAHGYCQKLLNDFGMNGQNYGTGGDQAADMAVKIAGAINPTADGNFVVTEEIGTNDISIYGTDPGRQAIFQEAIAHSIAWPLVPTVAKEFTSNSSVCTQSGTWFADGARIATTTNGSSLSCSLITYGPAIYYGYQVCDGWTGTQSISVDGGTPLSISNSSNGSNIATANGSTCTFQLARIPAAAGNHNVVISATSTPVVVEPFWLGSAGYVGPVRATTPPVAYILGMPPVRVGAAPNQSQATTTTYDSLISSTVATYVSDGLNAHYVPLQGAMNNTTDYDGGSLGNGESCPQST